MSKSETYTCLIERDSDGRVARLSLSAADLEGVERSISLNGHRAGRVSAAVWEILRDAGFTGRSLTASQPLRVKQIAGAHIELLLRAVSPVRRGDRIDAIAHGVAQMSREEASYWHAKARGRGGLKALRILLGSSSS